MASALGNGLTERSITYALTGFAEGRARDWDVKSAGV